MAILCRSTVKMAKQPPAKKRKKSLLKAEQHDLIAAAWKHYKSYVGAADEIEENEEEEEEEDRDIDEILEVVSLLSQLDIPKKEQKEHPASSDRHHRTFPRID